VSTAPSSGSNVIGRAGSPATTVWPAASNTEIATSGAMPITTRVPVSDRSVAAAFPSVRTAFAAGGMPSMAYETSGAKRPVGVIRTRTTSAVTKPTCTRAPLDISRSAPSGVGTVCTTAPTDRGEAAAGTAASASMRMDKWSRIARLYESGPRNSTRLSGMAVV